MSVRISLITAVFNRASTIESAIASVLRQRNVDVEYIIVDGNSTDGTSEIIEKHRSRIARYIREADTGIYNALNKGIAAATGDVVGFIHADDLLANRDVLATLAKTFEDCSIDAAYGDLVYVEAGQVDRIVRYWRSGQAARNRFRRGWMPPHPTFYLRRQHYLDYGTYREDFQISADYELLIRMMYKHGLKTTYIEEVMVKMRLGGKSNVSLINRLVASREDCRAWEENGLKPPLGLRFLKPLRKINQYWMRPSPGKIPESGREKDGDLVGNQSGPPPS